MVAFTWGASLLWVVAGTRPTQECERDLLTSLRRADQSYLVSTATPDTVGATAARRDARPIYGQVVNVERRVGPGAAGNGPARAVLVPWRGGERCRRERWAPSARWLLPGSRGIVVATLRPRAGWIGGLPTYDTDLAERQPYPQQGSLAWSNSLSPLLGIDALMDFLALLPTREADAANPAQARQSLWRWARAHPRSASREPVSFLLVSLCDDLLRQESQAVRAPFAGTYRWQVTLSGDRPRTMFARTAAHPDGVEHPATTDQRELYCAGAAGARYTWRVIGAASAGSFPPTIQVRHASPTASFSVALERPQRPDATVWFAELDPVLLEQMYRDTPSFHDFRVAWTTHQAHDSGGAHRPRGAFRRRRDGGITFEQELRLPDGRTLSIRGRKISEAVIP